MPSLSSFFSTVKPGVSVGTMKALMPWLPLASRSVLAVMIMAPA